jgi:phosphomannomutase / phosphoglucomutase
MKQEHAELAGEMSGHMFFADRYYGYDDAIYSACRLIEIVAKSNHPLSFQMQDVPVTVSTPELRIDCPDDVKFKVITRVAEIVRRNHKIVDIDGVRIPYDQGWGLVRASNTQPVLVMRFEASSSELLKRYQREMEETVAQAKKDIGAAA